MGDDASVKLQATVVMKSDPFWPTLTDLLGIGISEYHCHSTNVIPPPPQTDCQHAGLSARRGVHPVEDAPHEARGLSVLVASACSEHRAGKERSESPGSWSQRIARVDADRP